MFHTIITPENESELIVTLPKEYLHKKIEVRADELEIDTLTKIGEAEQKVRVQKALANVEHLRRSTKGYTFDRDEANER